MIDDTALDIIYNSWGELGYLSGWKNRYHIEHIRDQFYIGRLKNDEYDDDSNNKYIRVFMVSSNNRVIGTCNIAFMRKDNHDEYSLIIFDDFIIDYNFRKQHHGTELLRFCIDQYKINTLYVEDDNEIAIKMYLKNGFLFKDYNKPMITMYRPYI